MAAPKQLSDPPAASIQRTRSAFDRCGDRRVQIVTGVLDHHIGATRQLQTQATALVDAAARAVEIGQPHDHPLHPAADPSERKAEPTAQVLAQALSQFKTVSVGIDMHG